MRVWLLILLVLAAPVKVVADEAPDFNRDIRPILSEHCFACHGPDEKQRKAGLRLDLEESALADRDGLRAIVPGNVGASELVRRIRASDAQEIMPPASEKRPLSAESVAVLEQWIAAGAPYADHWAFRSPTKPPVPGAVPAGRESDAIDAFIRTRLPRAGLDPSPRARRRR